LTDDIATVRRFNRLYTRQIGLLEERFLRSPFSLAEARVLYEIANTERPSAKKIGETLALDPGYLSRILQRFSRGGLISRKVSAEDRRQSFIALTSKGRKTFAPLDRGSREGVGAMLKLLSARDRARVAAAMTTLTALVGKEKPAVPKVVLRPHRPGDLGWIVSRHGALYAEEYGWDGQFEGMVAEIAAGFVKAYDPDFERCWIAEVDGERAGSVALVRGEGSAAKLRLLLVEPKARGFGIGKRLVEEAIRFARASGYKKITLWTQSMLVAARAIYERAGFRKVREEPHRSFGKKLVGEYWELKL
jgi:DNA-binding MarR family transcriptional regulator/GNAT superfamily N-acetyltransferase